jgi:hypothetical protein
MINERNFTGCNFAEDRRAVDDNRRITMHAPVDQPG